MSERSATNYGPEIAPIMLVLTAPTHADMREGAPGLVRNDSEDKVSSLLRGMLKEAGIDPALLFITHVFEGPVSNSRLHFSRTPKHIKANGLTEVHEGIHISPELKASIDLLKERIAKIRPCRIITVGDVSLFALTGTYDAKAGKMTAKWRGSEIVYAASEGWKCTVVPIYEPKAIFINWSLKYITVHDLKVRVKEKMRWPMQEPSYNFLIEPTLEQALEWLSRIKDGQWVACDVETLKMSIVDCVGFATSTTDAICIPLTNKDGSKYWFNGEEEILREAVRGVLARARIIGQNYNYDSQYFHRTLGIQTRPSWDTLTAQHVLFPGTPKSLDYLASLWCAHYLYWKDENKNWTGREKVDNHQRWTYNCTDCVRTFEIAMGQMEAIKKMGFEVQMTEQMWTDECCFRTMLRGIRVNKDMKSVLSKETKEAIKAREQRLNEVAGHEVNPRSPAQVKVMLKELGLKVPTKAGKESTDKEVLEKLLTREGVMGEIAALLLEIRSLGTISSNVINAKLGPSERYFVSLNSNGAETYRLSSSKSSFGEGGNGQNITDGSRGHTDMPVPNLRKLFVPDNLYTMFEGDLQRADVQVVAWEADDAILKQMFREHADLHTENAKMLFNLTEMPTKQQRDKGKTFVHLTNYGGKARTCATKCGLLVAEADKLQKRWFEIHPGIAQWHKRIERQLRETRSIRNAFGYRRYYFDRLDGLLGQALAWIPQSTVGLVINRAWKRIEQELERMQRARGGAGPDEIMILLQVHDSLMGQFLTEMAEEMLRLLQRAFLEVVVPYEDPLIIGVDFKVSPVSWGDAKPVEVPK